jgi:hypothetical protein
VVLFLLRELDKPAMRVWDTESGQANGGGGIEMDPFPQSTMPLLKTG